MSQRKSPAGANGGAKATKQTVDPSSTAIAAKSQPEIDAASVKSGAATHREFGPTIRSIGAPPERHAARVGAEMTRWLIAEGHRRWPACDAVFEARNDGNPKAQAKMVDKLVAAAGPVLFDAVLEPGKRRRYQLFLHGWRGWNRGRPILAGEPIPERPWLAVFLQRVISRHARVDSDEIVTLLICHHAIARLAERCEARDPFDVLDAARAMSMAVLKPLKAEPLGSVGSRVPFANGIAVVCLDDEVPPAARRDHPAI